MKLNLNVGLRNIVPNRSTVTRLVFLFPRHVTVLCLRHALFFKDGGCSCKNAMKLIAQ